MKVSRPSPALVVSIIALVVACGGTATAAGLLIKNSSQIKSGAVNGSDVKNRSLSGIDIASDSISDRNLKKNSVTADKLTAGLRNTLTGQGFSAQEVVRRSGPNKTPAGQKVIATMSQLQPGTYLLLAKTTITAEVTDMGLGELLRQTKTSSADCTLTAGGDVDKARGTVASPYSASPATVNAQMTRTLDAPVDVTFDCTVNEFPWTAADTSIIAVRLTGSSRTDVGS